MFEALRATLFYIYFASDIGTGETNGTNVPAERSQLRDFTPRRVPLLGHPQGQWKTAIHYLR